MAGTAPCPTSQQIVKDCGATIRPNVDPAAYVFVVVQRVGVVHALDPATNIRQRDRLLQLTTADRLPDIPVDVGRIERDRLVDWVIVYPPYPPST